MKNILRCGGLGFAVSYAALLLLLSACTPSISREMLTPTPTASSTPRPTRTPDPDQPAVPTPTQQEAVQPSITVLGELLIEQYPIGPVFDYALTPATEAKNQQMYERWIDKVDSEHQVLWAAGEQPSLEDVNTTLKKFNYRLEKTGSSDEPRYSIYNGSQLITDNVTYIGSVEVNRSETDFLLPVKIDNEELWIIQKGRFEFWFSGEPRHLPVFAGDDLTWIGEPGELTINGKTVFGAPVMNEEGLVYPLELPYRGANKCPIQTFRSWNDQWVLEMDGTVLRGGQPLGDKYGYDEVFNWQALNGKEFFLFKKETSYGIHYDGQELAAQFDRIVRWSCADQQVGGFNFSARGNDRIAAFFAARGGTWYYTEITPLTR